MGLLTYEDEGDLLFRMADHPDLAEAVPPIDILYQTGPILNQGQTPQCVGYSWGQWLVTEPTINIGGPKPTEIYCGAQAIDPFPGDCTNPITQGTAVRSGAKFLQGKGYIGSYLWSWNAATVRDWLMAGKGPVVVGTVWYNSMSRPLSNGRLSVLPSSGSAGGHAYLVSGYLASTQQFRITNSWGPRWAQRGHAWIRYADMQKLFDARGEACTAVETLVIPVAITPPEL
jgi:hypothetical protein